MDRAACIPISDRIFFTDRAKQQARAIAICGLCPVRDDCLRFALEEEIDHGVWGGMTGKQRKAMRKNG